MNRFLALLCSALLAGGVSAAATGPETESWESPAPPVQLSMDPTLIPVGKGAIYFPVMTSMELEPAYAVVVGDRVIHEATAGRRLVIEPGEYTVVYGSGTLDQMMQRKVRVEEGATTLLEPDWAGLVIDVIDETRTRVREYYEILNIETHVSYGLGQGVVQGLGEKLQTWILPPGRYKIVKPGGNINDINNFGTIRLVPGELVHAILVIDSNTFDFRGFGYQPDIRRTLLRDSPWTTRSELAGNALLTYTPSSESGVASEANFTATIQWLVDARYEAEHHNVLIWSNLEEGLSAEDGGGISKYTDKAEIRPTYVYKVGNLLSPYVRVAAETRLFVTKYHFDEPTDYTELDEDEDTVRAVAGAETIRLGNSFTPITLKQGLGVNSILLKSFWANLNSRVGYGARQTFPRGAQVYNSDTKELSPVPETDIRGTEVLLLADLRLGRYVLLDTDFDLLMPHISSESWVFDGENRLRISLTNHISLLMTMEYWKNESVEETQTRYQLLLRFSKYL